MRKPSSTGYGPPRSARIVYVTITDDSYAKYFGTHILDRVEMARVNEALAQFGPAAVAYDLIFRTAKHARRLTSVSRTRSSNWGCLSSYRPRPNDPNRTAFCVGGGLGVRALADSEQLRQPREQGVAQPFYATTCPHAAR